MSEVPKRGSAGSGARRADANSRAPSKEREVERILNERAEALARPATSPDAHEPVFELLVLEVGGERYGIAVDRVREVRPLGAVTPVPGLPTYWAGLMNLRGAVYPVLDLGRLLGLHATDAAWGQAVIVAGRSMTVALMVDAAPGIRRWKASELTPATNRASSAVRGVTNDLVSILDIDRLLTDGSLVVDDGSTAAVGADSSSASAGSA